MTRLTLTAPIIVARPQKHRVTVATCVSANGKPPSVITWETRLKGEATFQETHNANGTVTVHSSYTVVPTREAHKQKLTCTVTYRKEKITESVVLNVQCKDRHSGLTKSSLCVAVFLLSLQSECSTMCVDLSVAFIKVCVTSQVTQGRR